MQMSYLYTSGFPFKNFSKLAQHAETICKKWLGKELWHIPIFDKSTDHDKPHFDFCVFMGFFNTISTSKEMFFFFRACAEALRGTLMRVAWSGPSNFT